MVRKDNKANIICRLLVVFALSRKLKTNLSCQYNYDTGKVEAVALL